MKYRYTIELDRTADEDYGPEADDGTPTAINRNPYHDGSETEAIAQVASELQEAMDDTGLPVGEFRIIKREVIED